MQNERHTRKAIIDKRLHAAGWNVADLTQVIEEFDIEVGLPDGVHEPQTPYQGHQFSDYVLLDKDGKALAVVEAKKTSVDAAIGREQAKQYCTNIQKKAGGDLPFCFYTNGHDIFFWDLDNYPPRKVYGFPTRDDLERYQYIRKARKALAGEFINAKIAGRDYQIRAIRSVMEAIEKRKRNFLMVMATGTGKTRTCIALVDALMRAGWAEKTLFLVDRIALRDQALEAFKEHLPNEPRWPKVGEKAIAKDRRIYVSTYPTMLNIIRDEEARLSPHFFDLVVVDESHRSIYNTYQEVLDYFSTITLGLTATPTDVIDHNTFKLFECEDGVPTFAYSYEEAINHIPPYLCDFQVMKIKTKFQEEGINKRTISLEDQKKLIVEGKEIEEINYEGTEIEKTVVNRGTNALIVREFMEECIKDHNGVLPGKSICFCIGMAHARRMEAIFDALYPEYKGELANSSPSVHYQEGKFSTTTDCIVARPKTDVSIFAKYCFQYFVGNTRILEAGFKGAGLKHISKGYISEIIIPLPPLEDQIRIATTLSKSEALITQRKESLRLLDELLKSTFLEMFGDPVSNQKGWEKKSLREISIKFSDGPFGSNLKTCHYEKTGIRVIRLNNIGVNKFLDADKAFISQKHFDEVLKKYTCLPGDVVIGTMGEPNIRVCIIPEYIEMAVNKADCILCRPNKNKALPEYLTGIMNSPSFLSLASNLFHGQTRTRVSMGQLATLKIPVPPINLQSQFAQIVEKVEALKAHYQASLKELENLYGSLSQRAFKGELDLSRGIIDLDSVQVC